MASPEEAKDLERNAFSHFVEALRVLSLDAKEQCEEMENYNAPWEVQHDVMDWAPIADSKTLKFSEEQRTGIARICSALEQLPDDALTSEEMDMTTHLGCFVSMNHPAWQPLREDAARLLALLEAVIRENEKYFNRGWSQ